MSDARKVCPNCKHYRRSEWAGPYCSFQWSRYKNQYVGDEFTCARFSWAKIPAKPLMWTTLEDKESNGGPD